MTQRDLAAAIGVEAGHIAYIENGGGRPSIPLIKRLSKTLGLDCQRTARAGAPGGQADHRWRATLAQKAMAHGRGSCQTKRC
jgi:transcriptional regulator with XRE-family HTH domain